MCLIVSSTDEKAVQTRQIFPQCIADAYADRKEEQGRKQEREGIADPVVTQQQGENLEEPMEERLVVEIHEESKLARKGQGWL